MDRLLATGWRLPNRAEPVPHTCGYYVLPKNGFQTTFYLGCGRVERDLQHSLRSIERLKPRAVDRVRVDFDAYLTFDKAPEVPVFIRDLSSRGFRCRCSEPLAIGSTVTLRIPNLGRFSATVAWQLGFQAGARFESPLPLPTILSIVLAVVREELEEPETSLSSGDIE